MGTFAAISAPSGLTMAETLKQHLRNASQDLFPGATCVFFANQFSSCSSIARENTSGEYVACDAATNTWFAISGTCFDKLGNSHPDQLLQQYLRLGLEAFCQSLEGFFAIAIGDAGTGDLIVITDIVGSSHAYVREMSGCSIVSSSSLLLSTLGEISFDPVACQEFLGMGIIYEDRSLYREIKKLPPASILTFRDGAQVEHRTYWTPARLSPNSLTADDATEMLWQEATRGAAKVGQTFSRIVCDLTGGYDSRAMAAAFLGGGCSFTTTVSGPEESPDVQVSTALAKELGVRHLHSPPGEAPTFNELCAAVQLTDGEYDLVEYSNIAQIHRKLAQQFEVSINGSFGEVARGYWWELLFPHTGAHQRLDSHKLSARRYAWHSSDDLFLPEFRLNLVEHMASVIDRTTADIAESPNTFQMDVSYLRMRMQRWQGRIASSTDRIWACLSPFMFRRVLETMLQAQYAVRQRSLLVRRMLAAHQPALANFPLEHGYPAAPFTARNFWRFWPVVPGYGNAAFRKAVAMLGLRRSNERKVSLAQKLWKSEGIREILRPERLSTTLVLDLGAVGVLLEASTQPGFSRQIEWNRLLTLELAMAASRRIRLQHRSTF